MSKPTQLILATVVLCSLVSPAEALSFEHAFGNGFSEQSTRMAYQTEDSLSGTGRFQTSINGQQIYGSLRITGAENQGRHQTLIGNFAVYGAVQRGCGGTMRIDTWAEGLTSEGDRNQNAIFSLTFDGATCSSFPMDATFDLSEALPKPDLNGNYTPDSGRTVLSETNGDYTWDRWTVVDSDPAGLNCREATGRYSDQVVPNGRVVTTFQNGEVIQSFLNRRPDAIFFADENPEKPYLLVRVGSELCFVRANTRFIRARSSFE
jgi:hypothetical protein